MRLVYNYKLRQFSKSSLLYYSQQIGFGNTDHDIKLSFLRSLFGLDFWIAFNKNIINSINKLDFIDIIIFSIWFNNSLKNKTEAIPKIPIDLADTKDRNIIKKIAFNSGVYWDINDSLHKTNLNKSEEYNTLGREIINCFNIS